MPIRAPTATEVASDFGAVQDWVRSWIAPGRPGFRVETAAVGGRVVGLNELPRRAWVDSYADAWRILRTTDLVRAFESAMSLAEDGAPRVAGWARAHPMAVLQAGET